MICAPPPALWPGMPVIGHWDAYLAGQGELLKLHLVIGDVFSRVDRHGGFRLDFGLAFDCVAVGAFYCS